MDNSTVQGHLYLSPMTVHEGVWVLDGRAAQYLHKWAGVIVECGRATVMAGCNYVYQRECGYDNVAYI